MTLDYVRKACHKINLKTETFGGNIWIYDQNGLLRSFSVSGDPMIAFTINATDFANWWRFMGYDK